MASARHPVGKTGNKTIRQYQKLAQISRHNGRINQKDFDRYGVKRGLRNEDGSGVLVGLTNIASIVAYEKIDHELKPMPGRLEYRGLDVKDLVSTLYAERRFGFEDTAYLLLFGELPSAPALKQFSNLLAAERPLPRNFNRDLIMTFRTRNIMNLLAMSVLGLYAHDHDPDGTSVENLVRQAVSLIAKFPVIVAYSHAAIQQAYHHKSLVIHPPLSNMSTAENFLHMLRTDGKFTREEAQALDIALVLHADHGGGNNSTFTTRCVSSSGTDTYSAIAAAIGSLKGPLHGGANKSVMDMLDDIRKNVRNPLDKKQLADYLEKLILKKAGDLSGKIYGFGHAVYTISDPRAEILKDIAVSLVSDRRSEKKLELLNLIEELVPEIFNRVKRSRKVISPNVDFYSGFVYECLGIPPVVYTPIFAMARIVGWMAHRIEELEISGRIIRPAYKAVCKPVRYVPLKNRR